MTWDAATRRTLQTWSDMKNRCCNPKAQQYKNYGARGIAVCQSWIDSFKNFLADMGFRPEGMTLDRIDNDGPYCKENCRWATRAEQRSNQRGCIHLTKDGHTMTCEEWSRVLGVNAQTLRHRFRRGLRGSELFAPPDPRHSRLGKSGLSSRWAAIAERKP